MSTGISTPRFRPSSASSRTQLDETESRDHTTTTHRASSSASAITWWNVLPVGICLSHHTDQPWPSQRIGQRSDAGAILGGVADEDVAHGGGILRDIRMDYPLRLQGGGRSLRSISNRTRAESAL